MWFLLALFVALANATVSYERTTGACRGGQSPGNNAGLVFFANRNCQSLCNNQSTCTGYVLPKSNSNWCETYKSKGATGDKRTQFWCFVKKGKIKPPEAQCTGGCEYLRTTGACRGGQSPGDNAGLKFYRNRDCESLCNGDDKCTGYVLPKSNSNWCETYTSPEAKGDGRNFWCYMKTGKSKPTPAPGQYVVTVGACRGGRSPGNNAGLQFFRDRNCKNRCNGQASCTGYVLPVSNSNWCETYTSSQATGDKRTSFKCYMKSGHSPPPTAPPTAPKVDGYKTEVGACRSKAFPANNSGLKFFGDRTCEDRCDKDEGCQGFVMPKGNSNWCETYTSAGIKGDGRTNFWCFIKPNPEPSCRDGDKTTCSCYKWYTDMCARVDLSKLSEKKAKSKLCKRHGCKYEGGDAPGCSRALKNADTKLKRCKKAKGSYKNTNGVTKPICECFEGCKLSTKTKRRKGKKVIKCGGEHTGFTDTDI